MEHQIQKTLNENPFLPTHSYRYTGWFGSKINIAQILYECMTKEVVKRGDTFVDLGSGDGRQCIRAASVGLYATGFEINADLVNHSRRVISSLVEKSIIPQGSACIREESYFSHDFINCRLEGRSISSSFEKRFTMDYIARNGISVNKSEVLHHIASPTVDLEKYNVFYAYAWPQQTYSIVELFARAARSAALLFLQSAPVYHLDRFTSFLQLKIREDLSIPLIQVFQK